MTREVMAYDVLIVGGGPAGLSAAIRLKQLAPQLSVCILEKGSEIGAHIVSGAVFEPRALNELIPDWQTMGAPLNTPVAEDKFYFLSENKAFKIPGLLLPKQLQNHGNYIISLSTFCKWLAEYATNMGVEIYAGFSGAELLIDSDHHLKGVATRDMGIAKDGSHKPEFMSGVEINAKYTLLAEGARGYLTEKVIKHFNLRAKSDPQTYGLGIKEVWEIDPKFHQLGLVQHTAGWPLTNEIYGGSFIYHFEKNKIALGLIVALDYQNPYLDPYQEMQRFKTHPFISQILQGGTRLSYGARVVNEGGLQSIPQLYFPGGALIGCAAGFLNVAKIKGSHNAMKTGMLAAEAVVQALQQDSSGKKTLAYYETLFKNSWVYEELYQARNFRCYFYAGLWLGTLAAGFDLKILQGQAPWTLHHHGRCRDKLQRAADYQAIHYPKADGKITFDRMTSVYLANIRHEENQPIHLRLKDPARAISQSYTYYDSPEQRYCPAGVYEIVHDAQGPRLQINSANCVHCKTCDLKDPCDNIVWELPEGGSGPHYVDM